MNNATSARMTMTVNASIPIFLSRPEHSARSLPIQSLCRHAAAIARPLGDC
jgi:hypothetical protein